MKAFYKPFSPYALSTASKYFGYVNEIYQILQIIQLTAHNEEHPHLLVNGINGIGKRSLICQVENIVNRQPELTDRIDVRDVRHSFDFKVIKLSCNQIEKKKLSDIVIQLKDIIFHKLSFIDKLTWYESAATKVYFKAKLTALEVGAEKTIDSHGFIENNNIDLIVNIISQYFDKKISGRGNDGLLIVIENCENICDVENPCYLFEEVCKRLSDIGFNQILFILTSIYGTPRYHSPCFEFIKLFGISEEDIKFYIASSLETTEKIFDDDAIKKIVDLSLGIPYLVEQMCECAIKADNDDIVSKDDLQVGIFNLLKNFPLRPPSCEIDNQFFKYLLENCCKEIITSKMLSKISSEFSNDTDVKIQFYKLVEDKVIEEVGEKILILEPLNLLNYQFIKLGGRI